MNQFVRFKIQINLWRSARKSNETTFKSFKMSVGKSFVDATKPGSQRNFLESRLKAVTGYEHHSGFERSLGNLSADGSGPDDLAIALYLLTIVDKTYQDLRLEIESVLLARGRKFEDIISFSPTPFQTSGSDGSAIKDKVGSEEGGKNASASQPFTDGSSSSGQGGDSPATHFVPQYAASTTRNSLSRTETLLFKKGPLSIKNLTLALGGIVLFSITYFVAYWQLNQYRIPENRPFLGLVVVNLRVTDTDGSPLADPTSPDLPLWLEEKVRLSALISDASKPACLTLFRKKGPLHLISLAKKMVFPGAEEQFYFGTVRGLVAEPEKLLSEISFTEHFIVRVEGGTDDCESEAFPLGEKTKRPAELPEIALGEASRPDDEKDDALWMQIELNLESGIK